MTLEKNRACRLTIKNAAHLTAFIFLIVLFAGGAAIGKEAAAPVSVREIAPGILEGYLSREALPNSLELLPPPPGDGSAGHALDRETAEKAQSMRDTPRWNQAIDDANLIFPDAIKSFSNTLGFQITENETPHLYLLLRRTLTDLGLSTYAAKNHYNRSRPFMELHETICTPDDESALRKDGSYPSGHTAIGWGWALILCELVPDKTDAILKRGWEFGESRIVCNCHWQSDVNAGRIMGAAAVARLHADKNFLADMEAAEQEIASLTNRNKQ
jgi:acid phosphatase (class A)